MTRKKIVKLIKKSIKELQKEKKLPDFDIPEIKIEYPKEKAYGDYSTNIAMVIAKDIKKSPLKIANLLISEFKNQELGLFDKIDLVKPGFINFFILKDYLQKQVSQILEKKEKFGQLDLGKDKKVQVEFISANPTGPLTVANSRGGPVGDVLGNVLKEAGFEVEKAYYINDYGMQILTLGHSVLRDEKAKYKGDYIDYLHKTIKEKDPYKAGQKAAKIIVEEMIKKTIQKLGIKYDEWNSETGFHDRGAVDEALEVLKKKGLIYKKEGALWFKSSQFGDERDRVVVKADGWKTYLAGDIAYHKYKFEKKKFNKVINIWGADHYGDISGLQAAVEGLGHEGKLDIILLQFVTLIERGKKLKMSKRSGFYVTMDELIDEVGSDVIRFFFLQRSSDTHLNFDLSLAKEQSEKNPVFYVQYAHARICSILKKITQTFKFQVSKLKLLNHPSELSLIKQLIRFPEIVEDTALDCQLQRLPNYATELATAFHRFYQDCKVLTEKKEMKEARIGLALATKFILKEILTLMGISAPERM
jgi:arginyl-tRNA synthetase